jgi:hypothetical protein
MKNFKEVDHNRIKIKIIYKIEIEFNREILIQEIVYTKMISLMYILLQMRLVI